MSITIQDRLVVLLRQHPWGGYLGPSTDAHPLGQYARCGCGWTGDYDPDDLFGAWRTHLAEMIAPELKRSYELGRDDQRKATIAYCETSIEIIGINPDPLAVGLAKGYQDIAEKLA